MIKEIVVDEAFIAKMDKYREPDKSGGLLSACSKSVVVFAELMLGFRLYSWQVYFLNKIQESMKTDPLSKIELDKEFLAITSRQIGKSTSIAILSIWSAVFNKYPGTLSNNTSVLISSASDVQAKKLLYEMKKLIRLGDRFMEQTYVEDGKPLFGGEFFTSLLDEHEPNNTTTITFKAYNEEIHGEFMLKDSKSGSMIKSYPPTSSVLGETASIVIIDEAGKTEKITDQFFYDYLYPTGNSTNAVRVYTSTPWVSSGFFYRMVDPDDNFSETTTKTYLFTVDAIKLENPNYHKIVMKTVDQLNKDGKLNEVQRAYFCRFVKGEQSYFNPEKVIDMFKDDESMVFNYTKTCDMGVDFGGQVKSKTVITISELLDDGRIIRRYHKAYEVGKDNTLIEDIADLMTRFNIERIIPDECPQGDYLIRSMKEKGWNVHPMNFRTDKVKKYGAFRSSLNKGKIMSYLDEDLKTEMLALEFGNTAKHSVISPAPGYNDDLIDSFLMSVYFYVQDETGFKLFEYKKEREEDESRTYKDRIRRARTR